MPNGLAFREFKGYETWETISISHNGDKLAVILGNPAMIDAYKAGIPENVSTSLALNEGNAVNEGSNRADIRPVSRTICRTTRRDQRRMIGLQRNPAFAPHHGRPARNTSCR